MSYIEDFIAACYRASRHERWDGRDVLICSTPDGRRRKTIWLDEKPNDQDLADFLSGKLLGWFKEVAAQYKEVNGEIVPLEEGEAQPEIVIPEDFLEQLIKKAQELELEE